MDEDSSVPRLALWVLTMSRRAATAAVAPSEDATRAPLAKRAKKRHAEAGSKAAKWGTDFTFKCHRQVRLRGMVRVRLALTLTP